MSVPGKDLVFALLMQDLKCWGVRIKYVWLWTCPLGAYQVAVLDNFWGWQGWVGGSLRTLEVSILCRLSLQCQIFLPFLPSVGMRQGLLWHCNRLELQVYLSWESLLWCYQAAHRTVLGLTLVCGPERLWCCVVSSRSGWSWVCWIWEFSWWSYLQLVSILWMSSHAGVSIALM